MKTAHIVYVLLAVVIGAGLLFLFTQPVAAPTPAEFDGGLSEDIAPSEAGVMCTQDVMECPDGSYVGRVAPDCSFAACPDANISETNEMIQVVTPQSGQLIDSPLQLVGEATGPWYFEASAPVELRDWQDNVIAQSYISAQGDWMVTNFVSFTGEIIFSSPYATGDPAEQQQGSLVLQKANPSGLPEHDSELVIPILFSPQ